MRARHLGIGFVAVALEQLGDAGDERGRVVFHAVEDRLDLDLLDEPSIDDRVDDRVGRVRRIVVLARIDRSARLGSLGARPAIRNGEIPVPQRGT